MRSFMGTTKGSAVLAVLLCTSELGITYIYYIINLDI